MTDNSHTLYVRLLYRNYNSKLNNVVKKTYTWSVNIIVFRNISMQQLQTPYKKEFLEAQIVSISSKHFEMLSIAMGPDMPSLNIGFQQSSQKFSNFT